jgi:hypothetical protein
MNSIFPGAQRTKWKAKDKQLFFRRLLSLFPQIDATDIIAMEENLDNPLAYFEIAHYDDAVSKTDPTIILMIDKGEISIDFLHKFRMQRQLNLIEMLLQNCAKMVSQRDIADKEFLDRFNLIQENLEAQSLTTF